MSEVEHTSEFEKLTRENEALQQKVDSYEQANKRAWKTRFFVAEKIGVSFLLGTQLKESLIRLLEGDLSKDAIADVLIATLWRFTRIGLFAFLVAIVPIGILTIQTVLLSRQNEKIDKQNVRLDQQTALLEADRRSAVIFESGNVLDAVARELADKGNNKDSLSFPLIGRIIALSGAMKEYKYLDPEADTLIKEAISPERGHLLVSLFNSKLDPTTISRINIGANYNKADLRRTYLQDANLERAFLKGAKLKSAFLLRANLQHADLVYSDLSGANLEDANLKGANLLDADIQNANLEGANLIGANLERGNLQGANLMGADLRSSILLDANLLDAVLLDAIAIKSQISQFLNAKADTTGMIWIDAPKE